MEHRPGGSGRLSLLRDEIRASKKADGGGGNPRHLPVGRKMSSLGPGILDQGLGGKLPDFSHHGLKTV